jgi:hypothetical protein
VGYDPLGSDVFYSVELPFSYQLTLQLSPSGSFDPAVYVFTDPADPAGSCVAGSDVAFAGETEQLIYVNDSFEGTAVLYVAVDSWDLANAGEFILAVTCDFVVATQEESWSSLKASFDP